MISAAADAAEATVGALLPVAYASGGNASDASTDPSEMYLVMSTVPRKIASTGGSASGVNNRKTPHEVATPFPPRNRSQAGYTWPTMAANPAAAGAAPFVARRAAIQTLAAPFDMSSIATSTPA